VLPTALSCCEVGYDVREVRQPRRALGQVSLHPRGSSRGFRHGPAAPPLAHVKRCGEPWAGWRDLVRPSGVSAQLAVDDLVMPNLAERRRVHVDRHRATLVVHMVDSRSRRRERLTGSIGMDATASPDDERLARSSALQHVDTDARASVVVKARVARLPPRVEPRFRVLVAPQELERPVAGALESAPVDALGHGASQSNALLGSEVVIRQRRCFDAVEIGHVSILHRNSGSGARTQTEVYDDEQNDDESKE
jgi:hypothetical protein